MPMPSAHIHEAISACPAPTACAAWNTITAELAKPTSTVMKPATTAGRERSRNRERGAESAIGRCRAGETPIVAQQQGRSPGAAAIAAAHTYRWDGHM